MPQNTPGAFADRVMRDFGARQAMTGSIELSETFRKSAGQLQTRAMGHPDFADLPVGGRRTASVACVFLDLTDFTGRSFWDDQDEVVNLAHAVLTAFVDVVVTFGGYPLGLRGDGLFAGFGPVRSAGLATVAALGACSLALRNVHDGLNPRLKQAGIEPVQARAGADYGPITFVRSGNNQSSDVNPLGFAANFAAKCEKTALSWEVVIGEGLGDQIHPSLMTKHPKSPKSYQRNGVTRTYRFYQYLWRQSLPHLQTAADQIAGQPLSSIEIS